MELLSIQWLVPVFLLLTKTIALSNSTCIDNAFANGYNASGSISYPELRTNDSYPESTWTWTRYVAHSYNETTNQTSVEEAVGLKTAPAMNLSDANTVPYTGCYMVLQGADDRKGNAKDDGSCKNVLSSDCVKEILKYVNSTAQGPTGTYMGNSSYFKCSDLTKHLPGGKKSACWQKWSVSASSRFFPDSSLTANATNQLDRTCPSVDKSETNPFARNVYNTFYFNEDGPNNFPSYDKALRNPLPMIVATWLKEDHSEKVKWEQGSNFVGTELIRIPANVTSPGSRTLAEALKSDAPARFSGGMIGVGMLSLALGLVL